MPTRPERQPKPGEEGERADGRLVGSGYEHGHGDDAEEEDGEEEAALLALSRPPPALRAPRAPRPLGGGREGAASRVSLKMKCAETGEQRGRGRGCQLDC